MTTAFEKIEDPFHDEDGGERHIRRIDDKCWISVLHRRTGFGWMEWETALVFVHDTGDRTPTWKDWDCLIIAGDRREELATMPREHLRPWYEANIDGNRNGLETIIEALS